MSGVKRGAVNFPKMLRTLEHRTSQVKTLDFLRKPLPRPSIATTGDANKDGVRDTRFYGPPVDFGYTETQSQGLSIPDWATDKVYYEPTFGLHFQNLKGLQNPKVTLSSETTVTGQSMKGSADFYVPSYNVLKNMEGFGGDQTSDGTPAVLSLGGKVNPIYGFMGSHLYSGWAVDSNATDYGSGISSTQTTIKLSHFAKNTLIINPSVPTIATEIKIGDVICIDSPESRFEAGAKYDTGALGGLFGNITGGPEFKATLDVRNNGLSGAARRYIRVPPDGATVNMIDSDGTSKTFEFDIANNGVTGSNIAVVPSASNCIEYAYAFVTAVNASSLKITAYNYNPKSSNMDSPYNIYGYISGGIKIKRTSKIYLQQDNPGTATTITYDSTDTKRHFMGNHLDGTTSTFIENTPEQILVTGVAHRLRNVSKTNWSDSDNTVLTVIRGFNGSTATGHSILSSITNSHIWQDYGDATKINENPASGTYGNHHPLSYLVKRGYAFAVLDAQNSGVVDETVTLVSTDGTSRTYTCKETADYANNQWSRGGVDHGVASFKAAVEHASGHNGKIEVELKSYTGAQNPWTVILKQFVSGTAGNTTVTENLTGWTITSQFAGGAADTNTLENGTTMTLTDAKGASHTLTTDNTLKEYESTSTKIGTNLTVQNCGTWFYSLLIALMKACRMDYAYKRLAGDYDADQKLWWEEDYPLEGSEATAKLDMRFNFPSYLDNYSTYDGNGVQGIGELQGDMDGHGVGPQQYLQASHSQNYTSPTIPLYADLITEWNDTFFTDCNGIANRHLAYISSFADLWQLTKGAQGNTEVTGNSLYSGVGHYWNGMMLGHPSEQTNRRFHQGNSYKGKFIQKRVKTSGDNTGFSLVEPYFYEFMTGDMLQEVDKEVYRFKDEDNVFPVFSDNHSGGSSSQRVKYGPNTLGISIPRGTYISGVNADRIKMKIKLTSGQTNIRSESNLVYGNLDGLYRDWNRHLGKQRTESSPDGGSESHDYSVNFDGFKFYFTQNNVVYEHRISFQPSSSSAARLNLKVDKWYEFDLPLHKPDIQYLYQQNNNWHDATMDDATQGDGPDMPNDAIFQASLYGKPDFHPANAFFPVWVGSTHLIANMQRDSYIYEEDSDPHMAVDVSTGDSYFYSESGEKLGGPISPRKCTGQMGSALGRDGQAGLLAQHNYDVWEDDTKWHGSALQGFPDIALYRKWGLDDAIRASFKDVVIYKPKKWRVVTVQEYDSEYIKLSCQRIGSEDNSAKRRAYGK